jgi:sugar phosphate isomerase/epimerase
MHRRQFLLSSLGAAAGAVARKGVAANTPKFGHRQANMVDEPGPAVFDLARKIQGLSGVELQVFYKGTKLWDQETLVAYQRAAQKTGLTIPSLAGVWSPGATLYQPTAEEHLRKAIQAAAALRATTILVACFEKNCPVMDREESYGPVVALLQKVSGAARDAGVTIGMETSLSPADDRKLIDLVDRPSVRVYYDLDNVERFLHKAEAVPGIAVLKSRIRQVHLKNEDQLLEQSGRVNWADAMKGLAAIGYQGWFVFESSHSGPEQCIESTQKNIAFATRHFKA